MMGVPEEDVRSGSWSFGGTTPVIFDDHARQSIPWYEACHELIVDLADHLVPAGGRCYELGCSTGVLTERLAVRLEPRDAEIVGVDYEPAMIELARQRCARLPQVRLETARVEELELERADLVVSYYTLQFVPSHLRQSVVDRIHAALLPRGSLILFEKTMAATASGQEMATAIFHDWKRRQGLSDAEIAAKERSLRGILEPHSQAENHSLLRHAGFADPVPIFRWLVWDGLLSRVSAETGDR